MSVRDRLNAFVQVAQPKALREVSTNQSLIKSGLIDSLTLFNLVLWIEQEIGSPIDLTSVNPRDELDTIDQIVAFVERQQEMK